jgi:hypothetical protein
MCEVYGSYSSLGPRCAATARCKSCYDNCIKCHKKGHYGNPRLRRYQCDNYKRVYLMRYMAAHVAIARNAIETLDSYTEILEYSNHLRIVSLGGAYGNESIALLDVLSRTKAKPKATMFSVDIEESWKPYHDALVPSCAEHVGISDYACKFINKDATSKLESNDPFDIVFVSWMLSDSDNVGRIDRLLENAMGLAADQRFIIITDRTENSLRKKIEEEIDALPNARTIACQNFDTTPVGFSVPDEITEQFGPKLTGKTCYWVLQRRTQ